MSPSNHATSTPRRSSGATRVRIVIYADQTRSFRALQRQADRQSALLRGFTVNLPMSEAPQRLLNAQFAPLTEAINRMARNPATTKALAAALPGLAASLMFRTQRRGLSDAALMFRTTQQRGLSDAALTVLMANHDALFRTLPNFARLLGTVPPRPPGPPSAGVVTPEERHIFTSDTFTTSETADVEEADQFGGLTRQQMRQVLIVYVYLVVFLALIPVALEHPETVGVVTSIVGGSAREAAWRSSHLIGQAFDTLYPPEE